jgi:hypothetical protein
MSDGENPDTSMGNAMDTVDFLVDLGVELVECAELDGSYSPILYISDHTRFCGWMPVVRYVDGRKQTVLRQSKGGDLVFGNLTEG